MFIQPKLKPRCNNYSNQELIELIKLINRILLTSKRGGNVDVSQCKTCHVAFDEYIKY